MIIISSKACIVFSVMLCSSPRDTVEVASLMESTGRLGVPSLFLFLTSLLPFFFFAFSFLFSFLPSPFRIVSKLWITFSRIYSKV